MWKELEKAAIKRERLADKFADKADTMIAVCQVIGQVSRSRHQVLNNMIEAEGREGFAEDWAKYEHGVKSMREGYKRAAVLRKRERGLRLSAFGHRVVLGLGRGMMPWVRAQ